ncbi:MAG: iron chelate uptake ABC transporter family permease subunit [Flavobacteriaceae bacterium]|nr:iron chelate uptake ABC transporter family permease subunit [Flavobacteriaceae bacterium]
MIEIFLDQTFWIIALGTGLLGASSGILGSFAVLKNQSLLGDAISHAALPGIVLAYIISGEKSSIYLLTGGLLCGILGAFFVHDMVKNSKIKTDTALGIVLSVLFGLGMMLLTYVQSIQDAGQAGLEMYLFGQAATILKKDIYLMLAFLIPSLLLVLALWKEIKIYLFDSEYAVTIGIPVEKINLLITVLVVIIIVMGLQTVGVVLMSSLLLAPAAAARQWTNSLSKMLGISALIGAVSGLAGTYLSAVSINLPTGPVIVLLVSAIVFISILIAPNRGLIFKYFKKSKLQHPLK